MRVTQIVFCKVASREPPIRDRNGIVEYDILMNDLAQ